MRSAGVPCSGSFAGARERGQAMLLTVLLLAFGVAGVVYTLATPARLSLNADRITDAALAQARDALIGRAAADANMPGSLPCPDFDDGTANPINAAGDGVADVMVGNNCPSYVGPLPWATLGLPDLRDGNGQRLWYALSPNFRDHPTASPLNSDTPGQLTITGTTPATQVIAIVFAAGAVVGTQDRDPVATAPCATTGTTIVRSRCPENYLEGQNADGIPPGDTTYTTAFASTTFNDKLMPITRDALFNVVNVRVAKEAIVAMETYKAAHDVYPFANPYGSASPYNCVTNLTHGRFPGRPEGCGGAAWGAALPAWFLANNWNLVTHYAISKSCADNPLFSLVETLLALPPGLAKKISGATLCGLADNLTRGNLNAINNQLAKLGLPPLPLGTADYLFIDGVTGADGARAVIIVTGRALSTQVHPCTVAANCLEDAENADSDADYVKPSRFPASNDRMAVVMCDISIPVPPPPSEVGCTTKVVVP